MTGFRLYPTLLSEYLCNPKAKVLVYSHYTWYARYDVSGVRN